MRLGQNRTKLIHLFVLLVDFIPHSDKTIGPRSQAETERSSNPLRLVGSLRTLYQRTTEYNAPPNRLRPVMQTLLAVVIAPCRTGLSERAKQRTLIPAVYPDRSSSRVCRATPKAPSRGKVRIGVIYPPPTNSLSKKGSHKLGAFLFPKISQVYQSASHMRPAPCRMPHQSHHSSPRRRRIRRNGRRAESARRPCRSLQSS